VEPGRFEVVEAGRPIKATPLPFERKSLRMNGWVCL
jgi:hypothetical protein